jgi:hypothetical protein
MRQGNVGRAAVTLWYNDMADAAVGLIGTTFPLSTNSIELVYTDRIVLINFTPVAGRVNLTTFASLQTSFNAAADYGPVSFYCRYVFASNVNMIPTTLLPGGTFSFSLYSTVDGYLDIDVVMVAKYHLLLMHHLSILHSLVETSWNHHMVLLLVEESHT